MPKFSNEQLTLKFCELAEKIDKRDSRSLLFAGMTLGVDPSLKVKSILRDIKMINKIIKPIGYEPEKLSRFYVDVAMSKPNRRHDAMLNHSSNENDKK